MFNTSYNNKLIKLIPCTHLDKCVFDLYKPMNKNIFSAYKQEQITIICKYYKNSYSFDYITHIDGYAFFVHNEPTNDVPILTDNSYTLIQTETYTKIIINEHMYIHLNDHIEIYIKYTENNKKEIIDNFNIISNLIKSSSK